MKFTCANCGAFITNDLVHDESVELCEEDGKALIPQGFTQRDEDWGGDGESWLANRSDLISTHLTDDPERISGCCDVSGCDGMNLRCDLCDTYVATARYDCWLPTHVILDLAATKIAEQGDADQPTAAVDLKSE